MITGRLTTQFIAWPGAPAMHLARQSQIFVIGATLLFAYLAQDLFALKWNWLEGLQASSSYKAWSGILLTVYLAYQWVLAFYRMSGKMRTAKRRYQWHKYLGILAPLFFYAHATSFGYGHLFLLTTVFLANCAVGLAHREFIPIRSKIYQIAWLISHVSLSLLVIFIVLYHIFIITYYH